MQTITYRTRSRSPKPTKAIAPYLITRQKLTAKLVEEPPISFNRIIRSSSDCFEVGLMMWDLETISLIENAYCLYLDRANRPICWALIGIGGMGGCMFDPKVVFAHAVLCGAHGLIMYHNHPSGNLQPSQADRDLTRKMVLAGKTLDIQVLDHLIMSHDGKQGAYHSFADYGDL